MIERVGMLAWHVELQRHLTATALHAANDMVCLKEKAVISRDAVVACATRCPSGKFTVTTARLEGARWLTHSIAVPNPLAPPLSRDLN